MSEQLEKLARAFRGVSLEYRDGGTDWPNRWRCRVIVHKNGREDYRIAVFGDTADEAVQLAIAEIGRVRERHQLALDVHMRAFMNGQR